MRDARAYDHRTTSWSRYEPRNSGERGSLRKQLGKVRISPRSFKAPVSTSPDDKVFGAAGAVGTRGTTHKDRPGSLRPESKAAEERSGFFCASSASSAFPAVPGLVARAIPVFRGAARHYTS